MSKKKVDNNKSTINNNGTTNLLIEYAEKGKYTIEPMYQVSIGRMSNIPKIKKLIGNVIKYHSLGDKDASKNIEEEYFQNYRKQDTTLDQYKEMATKWLNHCNEKINMVRDNDGEEITISKSINEFYDIDGFEYGDKAIIIKPAWKMPIGDNKYSVISKGKLSKVKTTNDDKVSETVTENVVTADIEDVETKKEVNSSDSKKDENKKTKKEPMYTIGYDENGKISVTKNFEEEKTMPKKKKKKSHVLKTKANIQQKKHKKDKKDKKKKKKIDLEELIEKAVEVKPREGFISRIISWWKERKVRKMAKDAERAAHGDCRPGLIDRIRIWFAEKFGVLRSKRTAVANG